DLHGDSYAHFLPNSSVHCWFLCGERRDEKDCAGSNVDHFIGVYILWCWNGNGECIQWSRRYTHADCNKCGWILGISNSVGILSVRNIKSRCYWSIHCNTCG